MLKKTVLAIEQLEDVLKLSYLANKYERCGRRRSKASSKRRRKMGPWSQPMVSILKVVGTKVETKAK